MKQAHTSDAAARVVVDLDQAIADVDSEIAKARERVGELEERRRCLGKALAIIRGEDEPTEVSVPVSAPTRPRPQPKPQRQTATLRSVSKRPSSKPEARAARAAAGERLIDRCAGAIRKLKKPSHYREIAAYLREMDRVGSIGATLSQYAARKELVATTTTPGVYRLIEWPNEPRPVAGKPASKPGRPASKASTPSPRGPKTSTLRSSGPSLQALVDRAQDSTPAPSKVTTPPKPEHAKPVPSPAAKPVELLPQADVDRAVVILRKRDRVMPVREIAGELGIRDLATIDRLDASLSALARVGNAVRSVGKGMFGAAITGPRPKQQGHDLRVGADGIKCDNCGEQRLTRSAFDKMECAA